MKLGSGCLSHGGRLRWALGSVFGMVLFGLCLRIVWKTGFFIMKPAQGGTGEPKASEQHEESTVQ